MVLAADDEHFVCDRGCGDHYFSHWVSGKQLEGRTSLDNEYVAVFTGEVESSICCDRRGAE